MNLGFVINDPACRQAGWDFFGEYGFKVQAESFK